MLLPKMNAQPGKIPSTNHPKSKDGILINKLAEYNFQYSRFDSVGLAQYLRHAFHDGNQVTGGVINSGVFYDIDDPAIFSAGSPSDINFSRDVWGAYFYVAAEVIDANGDTIAIVSDHFPYGEYSPDSTHQYLFQPLPKYYNHDEPGSMNPPIGGISEDVGIDGIPNPRERTADGR